MTVGSLPSPVPEGDDVAASLAPLLEGTHALWGSPRERRRMRAFGFAPAQEPGVLKRDWKGLRVRVDPERLRALHTSGVELTHLAESNETLLDGGPFRQTPVSMEIVRGLVDLVRSYERWVEVREGREGRLGRGPWMGSDRRPFNALAETRRLQRLLTQTSRARPR